MYAASAIPDWDRSLLVTGMRVGVLYRLKLRDDGKAIDGPPLEYFRAADRYRDLAVSPDGRHIVLVTDNFGSTQNARDQRTGKLAHPGAVLEFTYTPGSREEQ